MSDKLPTFFRQWLEAVLATDEFEVEPLVAEASTRRFWRIKSAVSRIAMLSPPETENNDQFVGLSSLFLERGIPVPDIFAYEPVQGFLLVTDFGHTEFLDIYSDNQKRDRSIGLALDGLVSIQHLPEKSIPPYTFSRFQDELGIFSEWCCQSFLGLSPKPLSDIEAQILEEIDSQPKVTVHRDYHSRNLLYFREKLGIVDFQDALFGPVTYDLASLFYDCYYRHSEEEIARWVDGYRERIQQTKLPRIKSRDALVRGIEICAIQRQLKAVGIFCRLWLSRKQSSHLKHIVPVLETTEQLTHRNGFKGLSTWLHDQVLPKIRRELKGIPS